MRQSVTATECPIEASNSNITIQHPQKYQTVDLFIDVLYAGLADWVRVERGEVVMNYPEAWQIELAARNGGPDPVYRPREFARWLEARRGKEAVGSGEYPVKGKGWVLVKG